LRLRGNDNLLYATQ
jgi:hypothetical protein